MVMKKDYLLNYRSTFNLIFAASQNWKRLKRLDRVGPHRTFGIVSVRSITAVISFKWGIWSAFSSTFQSKRCLFVVYASDKRCKMGLLMIMSQISCLKSPEITLIAHSTYFCYFHTNLRCGYNKQKYDCFQLIIALDSHLAWTCENQVLFSDKIYCFAVNQGSETAFQPVRCLCSGNPKDSTS